MVIRGPREGLAESKSLWKSAILREPARTGAGGGDMGRCEGRVAFVTGASRGIGRAIALRLAGDGRHVVLASRSEGR